MSAASITESDIAATKPRARFSQVLRSTSPNILASSAAAVVTARETSPKSPVKFTKPGVSTLWTPDGKGLNMRSECRRIAGIGLNTVRPSTGVAIHHHFQIDRCQSPVKRSMNRERRKARASTAFLLSAWASRNNREPIRLPLPTG